MDKKKIFVSVASYRDKECPMTISSLLSNAEYPERVFIGICQQNKTEDLECFDKNNIENNYVNQIRIMKLPEYEAKGPTWARYLCSKLWNGEDYYFQIDSHTKLVKNWDSKLINMVTNLQKRQENKKIVISHYPPNYDDYKENEENSISSMVPRICRSFFNDRNMISFQGAEIFDTKGECYNVPYIAAGMFFCESSFLNELPFDPYLPYLFVGEEILMSARFWTNGWDIYTPSENIAYHYYTRADEPKIWTDKKYTDNEAHQKVKLLLGLENGKLDVEHELYGMGKTRSLQDYYNFAGIDLQQKKVYKDFCKPDNKGENTYSSKIKSYKKHMIIFFIFVISILVSVLLLSSLKVKRVSKK